MSRSGQVAIMAAAVLLFLLAIAGVILWFCAIWTSQSTIAEKYFWSAASIGGLFFMIIAVFAAGCGP